MTKQEKVHGIRLSPEGRAQPAFIHEFLEARRAAGLAPPQEMWDRRNGWVHYRGPAGEYYSFRRVQVIRMTEELKRRVR